MNNDECIDEYYENISDAEINDRMNELVIACFENTKKCKV